MDSTSLNHYEERLYSVFKTFDVNNEEALNKAAVLALCDALQLEQRGAALVDTLFERRDQRVTFAQFRSGLLAVLGDPAPPAPAPPDPPASDDDSSGREVAPKFVFGSKKYGRRSRPSRGRSAPASAASSPAPAAHPPGECSSDLELEHSSRVDCERALQLCRRLRMDGIDRSLVESIFESVPSGEITVGEFFDRLNVSLSSSIDNAVTVAEAGGLATDSIDPDEEEVLPTELVVETWERAGVQRPRQLLAELGFDGAAVGAAGLERALDEEAGPLAGPARALLLLAALALARVRRARAASRAADAAAERDRLRADVDEANRRARVLAQEVDENHARLEADLTANLRRMEAKHAEAHRCIEAERATERERANAERVSLEAELARRIEAEQKLRAEADAQDERVKQLEARAATAEERAEAAERERARIADELRATAARVGGAAGEAQRAAAESAARAAELRRDNARLRDRVDELCAQLEAAARPRPPARSPPHTWHEEAGVAVPQNLTDVLVGESPPASLEASVPAGAGAGAGVGDALAAAEARHQDERQRLEELVKELEASLEAMRVEYERCEEYWSGKLRDERALLAAEQRAADERLARLARDVADYERQFAAPARLAAIAEAPALERQAAELDAAAAELQRREQELRRRDEELARRRDDLQRRERDLARLAASLHHAATRGCAGAAEAELRARLARAEAGAARLAARLAAADLLVKDLYVETCRRPLSAPRPL